MPTSMPPLSYRVGANTYRYFDEALRDARDAADLELELGLPGCRLGVAVRALKDDRIAFVARPTEIVMKKVADRGA